MRARSSALARRRSRSASRAAWRARSAAAATRSWRCRTRSPANQATAQTTVPANTPGPNPLRTTDGTNRSATLPTRTALRSSCVVRSGQRATV